MPDSSKAARSPAPRPLHLTLGSVVSPPATPTTPPSAVPVRGDPGPDATPAAEPSTSARTSLQPSHSPPLGPGPSPLSPTVAHLRKDAAAARKRSSISYLPPNPASPAAYLQFQSNRTEGADGLGIASAGARTTFFPDGTKVTGAGLARSNSVGGRASRTPRSATFGERSSTGSMLLQVDSSMARGVEHLKERPPATLSEKHADLLHFIAQKESKCLELRSQLAVHEAELLQLKKKWERIVNRGFERSLTPNSTSPTPPSYFLSSSPSHSPSSLLPDSSPPFAGAPAYGNSNAAGAVVLEGIKEGVQGVSRLIAAGLGSIAQVNATPAASEHAPAPTTKRAPTPDLSPGPGTAPLPLRLGARAQRAPHSGGTGASGHGQKESQSSASTTASHATALSFLSASSATSATSAASLSGGASRGADAAKDAPSDAESDFGAFEGGAPAAAVVVRRRSATLTEQEQLMVQDTGATPTMSPNPHFQRRRLGGGARAEPEPEPAAAKEDFDWDDGWDEPAGEAQAADRWASASTAYAYEQSAERGPAASTLRVPLDSSSSSELQSNVKPGSRDADAADKGASSWAGSMGKKWGEIKGSSTFTKNQKRASLLLSDIQQTFVASLISPGVGPASSPGATHAHPTPPSAAAAAAAAKTPSPAARQGMQLPPRPKPAASVSLLDDSDDESFGEGEGGDATVRAPVSVARMRAPVLVPTAVGARAKRGAEEKAKVKSEVDEDDWNW